MIILEVLKWIGIIVIADIIVGLIYYWIMSRII